jgi:hypothetical protein
VSKTSEIIEIPSLINSDKLTMVEELKVDLIYAKGISNFLRLHTVEYCLDVALYEITLLLRNGLALRH